MITLIFVYTSCKTLNLLFIHTDVIKDLFIVRWSSEGSNARMKEEEAYMMFLDFLYNCEGNW